MQLWRSLPARWLAGTLVFGLIFAMFLGPLVHPIGGFGGILSLTGIVASFCAPTVIGRAVRDDTWWLGPPVAILTVVIILLLIPDSGEAPDDILRRTLKCLGFHWRRSQYVLGRPDPGCRPQTISSASDRSVGARGTMAVTSREVRC